MPGRAERGSSERLPPLAFRRALRHHATPAERHLWTLVRAKRLGGLLIRRQHSIGPFVVDFYCAEAHLAIELDGSIHDDPARTAYDLRREGALAARGVRVLRVSNEDVTTQPEAVVASILAAALPLSLSLSLVGRGDVVGPLALPERSSKT